MNRISVLKKILKILSLILTVTFVQVRAAENAEINKAIQDGLAWLASQQNTAGNIGSVYPLAGTATSVLAFENEGHFPGGGTAYSINVEKGLDYIFRYAVRTPINPQTFGYAGRNDNPDSNSNGVGVYFSQSSYMYETGIVMQAIVASNTPDRVVTTGPLAGMTYREVMEDLVDFCAWAQIDGGPGRGGWRYNAYNNASTYGDNSVAQWPVLGLVAAEQWGISAPAFVKSEMQYWVSFIQDPSTGASGYDVISSYPNISKTGGLLVEFHYIGDSKETPRAQKALSFINSRWLEVPNNTWYGNLGHPYAMFSVFKGLELMNVSTIPNAPGNPETVPGDWWGNYCEYLVNTQGHASPDLGYWDGYTYWDRYLATPWYIIILQASVFPVAVDIVVPGTSCDQTGYDVRVKYTIERFEADGSVSIYKDGELFDEIALEDFKGSAEKTYNLLTDNVGSHTWKAVLAVVGGGISTKAEDADTGEVFATPQVASIPDQYAPFVSFGLDNYQTCDCSNVDWQASAVPAGWSVTIDANHVVTVSAPEGATDPIEITFTAIFHWPSQDCIDSDTAVFYPNRPPVADAGRDYGSGEFYEVLEGGTVELDGSASFDPDGDRLVTYLWDLNEDGIFETPGMKVTFSAAGLDNPATKRLYVFLKVIDEHGAENVAQARINVLDRAPVAAFNATPDPQAEGSVVTFTDASTSVVDAIAAWHWDFGGLGTSNAQNPTFTFPDNGTFIVSLMVTDDDGSTATTSRTITITNVAPTVNAGPDQAAECCVSLVTFNGSFTDPSRVDTHTFVWDFGDGSEKAQTLSAVHTYCSPGVYAASLTVTDDDGGVTTDQVIVTVTDTKPPIATVSISQSSPYYTTQVIDAVYEARDLCDKAVVSQVTLVNNGGDPVDITAPSSIPLNLSALAGQNRITVTARDASGNIGTATIDFEVILQLVGEEQIVIKPEVLMRNSGTFTAFVVMPSPYDALTMLDANADGAPHTKINFDQGGHKAIPKFEREQVTPSLLDTHFVVTGHFVYKGAVCQFVGADDIKRVEYSK